MNITADPNRRELTTEECISSLETLFKAYQNDSEFNYQLNVSNSPFNLLKKRIAQTSKKKKKVQKIFIMSLHPYDREKSKNEFKALINDGWMITQVTPIQQKGSTDDIHYVLEKEVEE